MNLSKSSSIHGCGKTRRRTRSTKSTEYGLVSKKILFSLFIKNIKVYTRDYPSTTERLCGEEIEIPMPDEIKGKILTGEFEFINIKKFQETTKFQSTESAYRMLYRLKAYSVKLFGKTYYYIP